MAPPVFRFAVCLNAPQPSRVKFSHWLLALALAFWLTACRSTQPAPAITRPPNVVIIFCDDMAYADISPFGSKTATPNLARLAREGMRFTDFYVGQAVCSASRAALLTGC